MHYQSLAFRSWAPMRLRIRFLSTPDFRPRKYEETNLFSAQDWHHESMGLSQKLRSRIENLQQTKTLPIRLESELPPVHYLIQVQE